MLDKLFVTAFILLSLNGLQGATLQVGSGKAYPTPCAALTVAHDYDTVQINGGSYSGDVCTIYASHLSIQGVNGRPHIDAGGASAQNKAIWVIAGSDAVVDNIEFSGGTSTAGNGAGIRAEGHNLTIRNSYFHNNQNGILTASSGIGGILIEYSEFGYNGAGDGYTHNMYIGAADSFTLRYSYSHHCYVGQLVKTRALVNYILYNRLTEEATGTGSYELDISNGGTSYVIGNVIQQSSATSNGNMLAFAQEGATNPAQDLYVINNTFDNGRGLGTFVIDTATVPAVIQNNIFYGGGTTTSQAGALLANNYSGSAAIFVNRANYDYHLVAGAPVIEAGIGAGSAHGFSLIPDHEYIHPLCMDARNTVGTLDIGAYEYGNVAATQCGVLPAAGVSVTISPTSVTLGQAGTQQYAATVIGTASPATWSISPAVGTISSTGLYTAPATITMNSTVTVSASVAGQTAFAAVSLTVPPSSITSTAAFSKADTTTQGNWKSTYGAEGYTVVADSTAVSPAVTIAASGQSQWTWAASTTDVRALQKTATSADRIAATWYDNAAFSVDVNCTDTAQHQVAIYGLDWDNQGRQQRVDVLDYATGAVLDTRTMSNFQGGAYLVWNIKGHVKLQVTRLAGANASLSGIFVGGAVQQTSTTTSFIKLDSSTSGNWTSVYGIDGYSLEASGTQRPSYATVTASGSTWTWASTTTDARALSKPASSDRIAATWYGSTASLDVSLSDTASHQVSIYCVDWDSTARQQRIDVVDANTGTVLDSRTISNFHNGVYLVWNVTGHVQIKATQLAGANAVINAVFFR